MLPGKKYTPEDILRIVWRRKWLLLLPAVLGAFGAYAYGRRLPNLYKSETLILVVPQRIPDSYVKSTVTAKIEDRLPTIKQQILSRSRLERIISEFNLYTEERRTMLLDDLVARMSTVEIDVKIEQGEAFRVSYISRDPVVAQKVTERLASLFIEENNRDRENLAESTSAFLDTQLEDAKRRLIEHEKRLEEYRRQFSGQLPTQLASNLQVIQNTQMQLQVNAENTNRDKERRLLIERQIADLQQEIPRVVSAAPMSPDGVSGAPAIQQLETARERLKVLETRLTDEHPDVRTLRRTIRDLEERVQIEQAAAASAASANESRKALTPAELAQQKRLRDLKLELENIDMQLAQKHENEVRLRQTIQELQAKVDAAPTRESELVELTRDYATLQATYANLAAKREDSMIAANLERRQAGEQFKVLDRAKVPQRPFSPDRLRLNLMGTAGGLLLGLLIAGFLELRDSTLRTEDEITRWLSVPVLAVVPVMVSPVEIAREAKRRRVGVTAALVLGMIVVSVGAYVIWGTRL
jgi:polysaccharide chain length determinant protein (PEP-CTERM system associated)